MNESDAAVFAYRAEKAEKYASVLKEERLHGIYVKGAVRTKTAGYVDFCVYRPVEAPQGRLPVVFSFHGGGFVLGFYEADGKYCQRLADATGCAVVNVDYPLAPEFKYPKPPLATYEAVAGIVRRAAEWNLDPDRVFVLGHSAGGCIAADLCLLDRDRQEIGISGQILDYAPLRQTVSEEHRKVLDASKAIKHERVLQYLGWYFENSAQLDEPLASPATADLHDLPDTLVISAEYDSLAGEEEEFARRAAEAGTAVTREVFLGCQHGFTHEEFKEHQPVQAARAWELMASFIRERL